ncbi:MAG: T9SS type A sorting domain-containing protein [bacterium]
MAMLAIGTQIGYLSEFRDVFGMRFVGLVDSGDAVYQSWRVPNPTAPYPQDYIIDQAGVVRYWSDQFDPWQVIATIDRLLAAGIEDEGRMQKAEWRMQMTGNPTSGAVGLRFAAGARRVAVVDAAGRIVLERAVGSDDTRAELDLAPMSRGVYIIRLDRAGESETRAVVRH